MTNEQLLQHLQTALEDQIKENSDLYDAIERVAEKQRRERAENTVVFAVEVDGGEILHEGPSYEAALQAAEFYDEARVVTWTKSPVRYVSPSPEEKVEGN